MKASRATYIGVSLGPSPPPTPLFLNGIHFVVISRIFPIHVEIYSHNLAIKNTRNLDL